MTSKEGKGMKESLFDIFSKHTNWEDLNNGERYIEMKQAANIYGDSLLSLGDRWIKAVEYDIEKISTMEPPHTHFNKDRQINYRISVFDFLLIIRNALESHGFVINELDHVTQWKLGVQGKGIQIEDGLSKDDAGRLYNKLKKQGFSVRCYRELCSNLYTVIGYQVEASPGSKKEPKKRKKPGATKTYFKQFIASSDDEDAKNKLVFLHQLLDNFKEQPATAALIIAAAIESHWVSIMVTAPSIEREFGIKEASIKPHLRKFRTDRETAHPYYKDIELEPYKELFGIGATTLTQGSVTASTK